MRGYYVSLKPCLAGLVLVSDMTVTCFLNGGEMVNLMFQLAGYRTLQEFVTACRSPKGLHRDAVNSINEGIKNCKIKLTHIGHWRKSKSLGPASNSKDSEFNHNGTKMTVEKYFQTVYKDKLPGGKLKYPDLPTINIGSASKPVLLPAEVIVIPEGQCRTGKITGDMTAQMIKYSAVRPNERMEFITDTSNIYQSISGDSNIADFGLSNINKTPMAVAAKILPSVTLKYAGNKTVSPGLAGSWNSDGQKCIIPPPQPLNGGYLYGVLLVGSGPPRCQGDYTQVVEGFIQMLERDCASFGVRLNRGGANINSNPRDLPDKLATLQSCKVRFVLVILVGDNYGEVKCAGNTLGLMTQCVKWKNVERTPPGYCFNLVLKINTKLGGTNHTLTSRLPTGSAPSPSTSIFQDPPGSISWLFDQPCMLVGMDVSHADRSSDSQSVASVVASMDGRLSQYACSLSLQTSRVEMIQALQDSMETLLTSFKARNRNQMPSRIIVFRDGVADGQFDQVLTKELPSIKGALELMGYQTGSIPISIVVCQKMHHTRIFYEDGGEFINPCPGLVADAYGGREGKDSITSARYLEYYINSHYALQGTAKPCKYTLIYDEIGLKISEIELLTYWSTYLYCRCNKSVSYATPAYYAHLASKQGRALLTAGLTNSEFRTMSGLWNTPGRQNTMFFV